MADFLPESCLNADSSLIRIALSPHLRATANIRTYVQRSQCAFPVKTRQRLWTWHTFVGSAKKKNFSSLTFELAFKFCGNRRRWGGGGSIVVVVSKCSVSSGRRPLTSDVNTAEFCTYCFSGQVKTVQSNQNPILLEWYVLWSGLPYWVKHFYPNKK